MNNKTINITIEEGSWYFSYALNLKSVLKKMGFTVNIITDLNQIPNAFVNFLLSITKILKPEQIQKSNHNIVVHASNLPEGKGFSPMSWQILEGKNTIPLCLFEASEEVDEGDIYLRDTITLKGHELSNEWRHMLGNKVNEMCIKFIKNYKNLSPEKQQSKSNHKHYPRRRPNDSELSLNKTLAEQFNLLRIVDNKDYPAFFYKDNKRYILTINQDKRFNPHDE